MEDPARGVFVPPLESCLMSRTKRISGVEKSLKFCRAIDPRLLHFFDLETGVAIPAVDVPVAAEVVS